MMVSEGRRTYRSEHRRQQAAQTRRQVVEAAVDLFDRQGYRATTYGQIAARAGVSVKTVQEHGPKAALLQAAVELVAFGVEGETDIFATDLGRAMLQVRDVQTLAGLIGDAMLAINPPAAGLWMTFVGAAHGDHELSGHHLRILGLIRGQVDRVLRYVDERGWLRRDIAFDDLVEAFCVITSPESYVRFVRHDGKTADEYRDFVTRTVRATILTS